MSLSMLGWMTSSCLLGLAEGVTSAPGTGGDTPQAKDLGRLGSGAQVSLHICLSKGGSSVVLCFDNCTQLYIPTQTTQKIHVTSGVFPVWSPGNILCKALLVKYFHLSWETSGKRNTGLCCRFFSCVWDCFKHM